MKFIVFDGGWLDGNRVWWPAGTIINDGFDQQSRRSVIPINAIALDQVTYDYMTSNGMVGLNYPYEQVRARAGVRVISPPIGALSILGSDRRLGSGMVLG